MKSNIIWSQYQNAIFEDIKNGVGHTIILARSGSAKTSSLVEGIKYIPKGKKAIFVAFNKKIAEELDERINKSYIEVRTIHSKSFETIKKAFGKVALDPDKALNIIEQILSKKEYKKFNKKKFELMMSILKAVNLCKGSLVDTPTKIDAIIDEYNIEVFDMERKDFITVICAALRKCKEIKTVIDYQDMVHFASCFNLTPEQYDMVAIDEIQDLSAAQISFALSLCKPNGRIIAAGDPAQVLYHFNSVAFDTIEKLQKRLNAKILPLPISYRCSQEVIKLAQTIVPDIQQSEFAKKGSVQHLSENTFLNKAKPGDFILSRLNAPLIYHCLALLRMNVSANIQGKDVGANLSYMIKKSEAKTVIEFTKWLNNWKNAEVERLQAKNRDPILILDKVACFDTLCEGAKTLEEVLGNIKRLFNDGDDKDRVILSSIHKAKGLERDNVFVLMNTFAKKDISQETRNLKYVAFTRARDNLFLVY